MLLKYGAYDDTSKSTSSWTNCPLLLDTEAVVKAMLYIWLNPVEAGLVSSVKKWKQYEAYRAIERGT